MKLDSLPVYGSERTISELSEYELYEHYDGFLGKLSLFRRLYVRTKELPDILVEAAAFRLGCNDHETGEFGWCPWEVDDPSVFPQIRRFIEKTGNTSSRQRFVRSKQSSPSSISRTYRDISQTDFKV